MRKEDLSPEDLAAMQSMYDHAVEDAKRDLADAISWQPLWDQLMTPGFRETLEACLDEVSFDRLQNLALQTDLLSKSVNDWAYGKQEML
jgi:hypothetical protein